MNYGLNEQTIVLRCWGFGDGRIIGRARVWRVRVECYRHIRTCPLRLKQNVYALEVQT